MSEQSKKIEFQIMKKQADTHGGFGAGTLSLSNVSPIIIDVQEKSAKVDIGALHAKSDVEKGIKFSSEEELVPNGKWYWLVWVTVHENEQGKYYYGMTACEMKVDREARKGFKLLPIHVNRMDKSMKGHFIVDNMDEVSKEVLKEFLREIQPAIWENTPDDNKKWLD